MKHSGILARNDEPQQDVACRMQVTIALEMAAATAKHLVSAQLLVDPPTPPAGLASPCLVDDRHLAPRLLAHLVQESLLKPIMGPGGHGTGGLAANTALAFAEHL